MLKNYMIVTLRNLKKYKAYSLINISGLAVGLACFMLIMLYVNYEFSYEKHHNNLDRIYQVYEKQHYADGIFKTFATPTPLAEALRNEFPEIEAATKIANQGKTLIARDQTKYYEDKILFADSSFFNVLTFSFIRGDKNTALKKPNSVVITREISEKYFGGKNPLGQTLNIDNRIEAQITGVLDNLPSNSTFQFDFLIAFPSIKEMRGERYLTNWNSNTLFTYVLLQNNVQLESFEKKIANYMIKHKEKNDRTTIHLMPLDDLHLYSTISGYRVSNGNIMYVYIFSIIAFMIILIACFNFMNLSTARSAKRAREVGIRKVAGVSRLQLIFQFLGESTLLAFISLFFAVILVVLVLPSFGDLSGKELTTDHLKKASFILQVFLLTLLSGILAGSYPALFLSSFKPVKVLKSSFNTGTKGSLFRKSLVVLQFSISIGMIVGTILITNQLSFIRDKDLGYDKKNVIILPVRGEEFRKNIDVLRRELIQNPKIENVSGSLLLPSSIGWSSSFRWEGGLKDNSILLGFNRVDYDFINAYKIEMAEGRNFSREFVSDTSRKVILNEEAVRKFGWKSALGKKIFYPDNENGYTVIGVMKDFHFTSLKSKINPVVFFLIPEYRYISVRIHPDEAVNTVANIEQVWNRLNPFYPFDNFYFEDQFDRMYRSDKKLNKIFSYFSVLTIFISCLGLFGLASFAAEQRTREIGVRKVMGASIRSIVVLLSKEFLKWVLISNIIAWPAAYFYINNWMQNFAYRTGIDWTAFIYAGLAAVIIALATVCYQTVKAALANPANSLRYE